MTETNETKATGVPGDSQVELWDRTESCSRDFAVRGVEKMRNDIVEECKTLRATIAYMNEVNPNVSINPIEMCSFVFSDEMAADE